ncbi:hypothetical protein OG523_02310 [Streptomyces virginiae]|uniref:hypothetical protein n=1 Tax=Streptomyces virginiae TaxID=1961 RepID=UPI00225BA620|nr:hypothetical protein [Streptomyces virginiae]MCX5174607.1 hypothetical protein [Streptomyces virginiae]
MAVSCRGGQLPGYLDQERGRPFGQRHGSVADNGQVRSPVRRPSRKVDVRFVQGPVPVRDPLF